METISTVGMNKADWLLARRGGIGGSDAAAVMGLNPYKSPIELYFEKTAETEPDTSAPSESAYWGTVLEAPIAARYAELHPEVRVRRNNHILVHPEYNFIFANLDREIRGDDEVYGLEIKTASYHNRGDWDEGVPIPYAVQCQHYMAVTGYTKFVVAALIGGQTYVEREIARDDEIITNLIEKEKAFWHNVVTGTPPEWDGSKSAWQILKEMYPSHVAGKVVELPSALTEDIKTMIEIDKLRKEAEKTAADYKKKADVCKQKIAAAIGDAERGILPGFRVSYPTVSIPEKVTKAYTYRRMTVKEEKNEEE